jgi:hypothetical protein
MKFIARVGSASEGLCRRELHPFPQLRSTPGHKESQEWTPFDLLTTRRYEKPNCKEGFEMAVLPEEHKATSALADLILDI